MTALAIATALSTWAIVAVTRWSFSEDRRRQHAIRRLTRQAQHDRELRRASRPVSDSAWAALLVSLVVAGIVLAVMQGG